MSAWGKLIGAAVRLTYFLARARTEWRIQKRGWDNDRVEAALACSISGTLRQFVCTQWLAAVVGC